MSAMLACGCYVVTPGDGFVRVKLLVPADGGAWTGISTTYNRQNGGSFAMWVWRLSYHKAYELWETLRQHSDHYGNDLFICGTVTVHLRGNEDEDIIVFDDRAADGGQASFIAHGPLAAALRRELCAAFPEQP